MPGCIKPYELLIYMMQQRVQLEMLRDQKNRVVRSKEPGLSMMPKADKLRRMVEQPRLFKHLAHEKISREEFGEVKKCISPMLTVSPCTAGVCVYTASCANSACWTDAHALLPQLQWWHKVAIGTPTEATYHRSGGLAIQNKMLYTAQNHIASQLVHLTSNALQC